MNLMKESRLKRLENHWMLEWYFPWTLIDWMLRAQLLIWITAIAGALCISVRTIVLGRPWLRRRRRND